MNYSELAKQINKLVREGIRTLDDREECLKTDNSLRAFAKTASEEDLIEFKRICYGIESFSMIAAGLIYENNKEKYK